MFEDSLVESGGRIRTRSRWFAIGSFFAQAALLLLLILNPLFHPQALPRQSIERLLVAPPPPRAPAPVAIRRTAAFTRNAPSLETQLQAPSRSPEHLSTGPGDAPPALPGIVGSDSGFGIPGSLGIGPPSPLTVTLAQPPAPRRPVAISSGVAAGQLLGPIRPVYPAIAKQARIQGTVILRAAISRQGTIENLMVIDGPPMLRQSALGAVAAARYRPFLLNGEPIEVETTIRVVFSLTE